MKKESVNFLGNFGNYIDENNIISFQIGNEMNFNRNFDSKNQLFKIAPAFLNIDGYNIATRGEDNRSCETIENNIKRNRLLPRLIEKQVKFLYGKGLMCYTDSVKNGKVVREWFEVPEILDWLNSWAENGMELSAQDFALAIIKRFYYFRDFFVKIRMSKGKAIGRAPIAGLELLENKHCRLATLRKDVVTDTILYKDFTHVLFGNWQKGLAKYKVYPLYRPENLPYYNFAAISHHKESTVSDFYGLNETHEGVKTFLKTSNELPEYIDSFLSNALAAKIHVVIPYAWMESKRKQIKSLCEENKRREKENLRPLRFNDIEIGTTYNESSVVLFMQQELRRLSEYLSGSKNQGKAYATFSFKSDKTGEEERWKIETVDLKYKEYISSLIDYDKRVDEVLISAVGIDSSITAVSKPGMISKSGSDAYYNYIIYLMSLTPDDQKCAEPFNLALQVNFPHLYKKGIRIGFYREIPSKQEEISTKDRLKEQQS